VSAGTVCESSLNEGKTPRALKGEWNKGEGKSSGALRGKGVRHPRPLKFWPVPYKTPHALRGRGSKTPQALKGGGGGG